MAKVSTLGNSDDRALARAPRWRIAGSLAVLGVALAAGAARANVDLSTYAAHLDGGDSSQNHELYQMLYVAQPYLGPPSQQATSGTANGASWNDFAQASFGVIRLFSSVTSSGESVQDHAVGDFEDEVVFNNLPAGTAGVATFQLHLTGDITASGGGYWDYDASFEQDGADRQLYAGSSSNSAANQDVDRTLIFTLNFISGVTQHIRLITAIDSGDIFAPGGATVDFSHTALWGGLQSVVVGGQDVTRSVDVVSSSGFNYETAASEGVPEPISWALMVMGFGGLGAMLRRRRAAVA
jgi:hypothetical protein